MFKSNAKPHQSQRTQHVAVVHSGNTAHRLKGDKMFRLEARARVTLKTVR